MVEDGPEGAAVSIRTCFATPSRVVLSFDGDPEAPAVLDGDNYRIGKASEGSPRPSTSLEYDFDSRVAVLSNPIKDVLVGEWLRIVVSPTVAPNDPPIAYYVQVESALPLLRSPLERDAATGLEAGDRHKPISPPATRSGQPADREATRIVVTAPPGNESRSWAGVTPAVIVVVTGLAGLVTLAAIAMFADSTGDMSTIATAAFGVIGSIIGAFFGVHAGLGDRSRIDDERRVEAAKSQMLAAMMPEESKQAALDMLKEYSPSEPRART
jgi:hypothetical protein